MSTPTSVDCGRDMRFRRSFRSLMECVVPSCCGFPLSSEAHDESASGNDADASTSTSTQSVTGTFFGYRKGRVSFCIQDCDGRSSQPLLLLEFAVPTAFLAREMQHSFLRIALSCSNSNSTNRRGTVSSLLKVPVWSMYCNGRKVGFAMRRETRVGDHYHAVLKLMKSVSVGAGVLPVPEEFEQGRDDQLMYLRATFQRIIGSPNSQSFHLINPAGSSAQELSIFLLR
ncbi:hypothetical protein NMG60_11015915 [Bertholletia excelsa]